MERALAASGLPRRPAEAPLEYLERALVDLDATAASARRLTDLFRIAKFSDHPVDAQAKEDAISALEAVRDELRDAAVRTFAGFALTATAALAAVLVLRLVRTDLAEEVFVLVLGAATLLALVAATRGEKAQPSSFERALRPSPPPRPNRPLELDRLERDVTLGVSGAFHLRHKLLPQLREIAAQRLADRRGAALSRDDGRTPTPGTSCGPRARTTTATATAAASRSSGSRR